VAFKKLLSPATDTEIMHFPLLASAFTVFPDTRHLPDFNFTLTAPEESVKVLSVIDRPTRSA
jgi:hypothetical protein